MFEHEDLMKLSENELWDQLPKVEGELKSDFVLLPFCDGKFLPISKFHIVQHN